MERFLCAVLLLVCAVPCASGLCLEFKGGSWLEFEDKINLTDSAHYKLSFKTTANSGEVFFARGPHYDFERLFIREGELHYFLFNPTRLGNGGTFGTHVRGVRQGRNGYESVGVTNDEWHTVEFFRNVRLPGMNHTSTGIIVDGHKNIDSRIRENVNINPPFFIGGSPNHENFYGVIRDFEEVRNGFLFHETAHPMDVIRYSEPPC